MRKPRFAEINLGAMAGLVVGGIGGLFAVGVTRALILRDATELFGLRKLSLICWLISGLAGWVVGGQIGPRVGDLLRSERAEMGGGAVGVLIPVLLIALWGWYMTTH